MITLPKPIAGRTAPRPKLAATIVLVRDINGFSEILMGKRSARHDFMPSVYVFPGGRVDPSDSYAPSLGHINARTSAVLQAAMPPARARACALAAVRETFEETSLILGQTAVASSAVNDPSWKEFHAKGYLPILSNIEVFGRAITPPHRNKRFDTWFFITRLDRHTGTRAFQDSAELEQTGWFSFKQAEKLDMHRATQMMLKQAQIYLEYDNPPPDIFFSRAVRGKFQFSRFPQ